MCNTCRCSDGGGGGEAARRMAGALASGRGGACPPAVGTERSPAAWSSAGVTTGSCDADEDTSRTTPRSTAAQHAPRPRHQGAGRASSGQYGSSALSASSSASREREAPIPAGKASSPQSTSVPKRAACAPDGAASCSGSGHLKAEAAGPPRTGRASSAACTTEYAEPKDRWASCLP